MLTGIFNILYMYMSRISSGNPMIEHFIQVTQLPPLVLIINCPCSVLIAMVSNTFEIPFSVTLRLWFATCYKYIPRIVANPHPLVKCYDVTCTHEIKSNIHVFIIPLIYSVFYKIRMCTVRFFLYLDVNQLVIRQINDWSVQKQEVI